MRLIGASLAPPGCCIVMERCERALFERLHQDPSQLERRQAVTMALEVSHYITVTLPLHYRYITVTIPS